MCHFKPSQVADLLIILITFVELETIEDDEVVVISTADPQYEAGYLKSWSTYDSCISLIKFPSVTTSDSSLDM